MLVAPAHTLLFLLCDFALGQGLLALWAYRRFLR